MSFQSYRTRRGTKKFVIPALVAIVVGGIGLTQLFTSNAAAPTVVNVPANILNLTNWKLTLPTGSKNKPDEIKQAALNNYINNPFFTLNTTKDAVVFRTNNAGVTTSGSSNPRTELREMTNNGTSNAAWSSKSGIHTMTIRQKVNRLTTYRPFVVIGQIHDSEDDVTALRLEGNRLWITDGDNSHGFLVDGNYKLGTPFTFKFAVGNGLIYYWYNDVQVKYGQRKSFSGAYFKAGNYLQSNTKSAPKENPNSYSEVEIYKLDVTHQ